jgi:sugar phosphate isomerase/epimerase
VKFCINQVTFGERGFPEVVAACAAGGFDALELWLPYVERFLAEGHSEAEARRLLQDHGVAAAGACYVDRLFDSTGDGKREAFDRAKSRFELCQALGAPTIALVGDGPARLTRADYGHAVERAREAGELADSFGLTVAIEFVAGFPFLGTLSTTARLVEEVDRPNVGILFDTFHFYAGRSKSEDFECVGRRGIAFVHLNDAPDVPRETLTDAQRVLPGEGCFPLLEMLDRIEQSGYEGCYSVELFNADLWAQDPVEVARKARAACDCLAE